MKNGKLIIWSAIITLLSCGEENNEKESTQRGNISLIKDSQQPQSGIIDGKTPVKPIERTTPEKLIGSTVVSRFQENPSREELNELAEDVLKILEQEDQVARQNGKKDAAFMKIRNDKKVMIIGDMHGCLEALLCIPVAEKILQEGGCVITLGDMIDQRMQKTLADLSLRCLYEILNLKKKYPANVIVLRGNHEAYFNYSGMGFSIDPNHCDEIIRKCIKRLPLACIVENSGKKFFCVHGGICQEMYTLYSEDDNFGLEKFEESIKINNKTPLRENTPKGQKVPFEVLWNDFKDKTDKRRRNVALLVVLFLLATGCEALFRGHDPSQTNEDNKKNNIDGKVYTILSNSFINGESGQQKTVQKDDDRNARYAIIENGKVNIVYFTNDLIEGTSMNVEPFVKRCKNSLRTTSTQVA